MTQFSMWVGSHKWICIWDVRVSEHFPISSHFLTWWRKWGGGLGEMGVRWGEGGGSRRAHLGPWWWKMNPISKHSAAHVCPDSRSGLKAARWLVSFSSTQPITQAYVSATEPKGDGNSALGSLNPTPAPHIFPPLSSTLESLIPAMPKGAKSEC